MSRLTPEVGERDHVAGPADARVTLVEYGDFECPACAEAAPVLRAAREAFGPNLRFVFRHFVTDAGQAWVYDYRVRLNS